jgi:hypothetical protein
MFKVLVFVKRRQGLSREEFVSLFEQSHVPMATALCEDKKTAPMLSYERNYILYDHPLSNVSSDDFFFDAIVECVFSDEESYLFTRRAGERHPEVLDMLTKDHNLHTDVDTVRYAVVKVESGGAGAPKTL